MVQWVRSNGGGAMHVWFMHVLRLFKIYWRLSWVCPDWFEVRGVFIFVVSFF